MSAFSLKVEQIEKVFAIASKQKAWDHFSKAQRKNLDMWRKQAQVGGTETLFTWPGLTKRGYILNPVFEVLYLPACTLGYL